MNGLEKNDLELETEVAATYRKLTKKLLREGWTVTTMESATSGQIISLVTDTEGSSGCVRGAFVTYCNEAKIARGVPAEVIDKYTVYSRETAEAMAKACRKEYEANIGIGVTGTMGNIDPANAAASVPGQVYFAFALKGIAGACEEGEVRSCSFKREIPPRESRKGYKMAVAAMIAAELEKLTGDFEK